MKKIERTDIKVSFLCNNKCKFCVQGNKRKIYKQKEIEELKTILSEMRSVTDQVVFTGGEPTIRNDIIRLVEFANKLDFKLIQFQTNGRMFAYKDFCREVISAGANEFALSIHGHNSNIHDFLTSVPGSFRETVNGIKNLKEMKQNVITNTVITAYNYKFIPAIADLLNSLDIMQYQFAFIHITGMAAENHAWIVPRKSQIMPFIKEGLNKGIKLNKRVMTEGIPYCLIPEYEHCVSEMNIPRTVVFDCNFVIKDYTKYRINEGKAKRKECNICKYNCICEGPWKEYPQLYGWEEFKAVL